MKKIISSIQFFFILLFKDRLEKYLLKNDNEDVSLRYHRRIASNLPGTYQLTAKDEARQCLVVNVSYNGVMLEILDASSVLRKKILRIGQTMSLKVDSPYSESLIETAVQVKWSKTIDRKQSHTDFIGLEFKNITNDARYKLLLDAYKRKRRRFFRRLTLTTLSVALVLVAIWSFVLFQTAAKYKHRLSISEKQKIILASEIKELNNQRVLIERSIANKNDELNLKKEEIEQQESRIARQKNSITLLNKQKKDITSIIDQLSEEWSLNSSDPRLILDKKYHSAKNYIHSKQYQKAIPLLKEVTKKYPSASLGWRFLAVALYKTGNLEAYKIAFQRFTKQIEIEINK